jgi:AraC-like DNA-binding protein
MIVAPPLTRVSTLDGYVRYFARLGAPVESTLRRFKLPVLLDEQRDGWVCYPLVRKFTAAMADREGIPVLGLAEVDMDAVLHPSLLGPVLEAPNLERAVRRLSAVVRSQNTGANVWLEPADDLVRLCVGLPLSRDFPGHALSEMRVLRTAERLVGAFAGPGFEPSRVLLTSRPRDLRVDVESAYRGVRVYTDQRRSAIEFPRRLLYRQPAAPIAGPARGEAGEATAVPSPGSVADMLAACLGPYLPTGYPHASFAAELFACSLRTLQRRLAREGTSYSEVVEDARRRTAVRVLRNGQRSLAGLADLLGYSEHSAFTRAFRRWTGTTPARYRARMVQQRQVH